MSDRNWIAYNFAILRVVPHVHLGCFANVGVVVHARTADFLGMRLLLDAEALRCRAGDTDPDLLQRYLHCYQAICDGNPSGGPIALLPPSERFHWLTAPRSDVLQSSPVHEGLCDDPRGVVDELFLKLVR